MKRKLIKQGAGGYTIYLPKKWIDAKGLTEGNEIEVQEEGGHLLISTHQRKEGKSATINIISKDKRFVQYILNNYYRAGYDKITLQGEITEHEIHAALRLLLGFEIITVGKHEITIESVAKPSDYDIDQLCKRIFFLVRQDLLAVKENLLSAAPLDTESLARNSDTVIRTSNLCIRLLAQHPDPKQGFRSTLANLLTWVHRQLYYLSLHLDQKTRPSLKPKEKEFIVGVSELVSLLYDGIYTKSFTSFEKIHQHYNRSERELPLLLKNQNQYGAMVLSHFSMIQKYIHHATSSGIGLIT